MTEWKNGHIERALLLNKTELFDGVSMRLLMEIAARRKDVMLSRGEKLVALGDPRGSHLRYFRR